MFQNSPPGLLTAISPPLWREGQPQKGKATSSRSLSNTAVLAHGPTVTLPISLQSLTRGRVTAAVCRIWGARRDFPWRRGSRAYYLQLHLCIYVFCKVLTTYQGLPPTPKPTAYVVEHIAYAVCNFIEGSSDECRDTACCVPAVVTLGVLL